MVTSHPIAQYILRTYLLPTFLSLKLVLCISSIRTKRNAPQVLRRLTVSEWDPDCLCSEIGKLEELQWFWKDGQHLDKNCPTPEYGDSWWAKTQGTAVLWRLPPHFMNTGQNDRAKRSLGLEITRFLSESQFYHMLIIYITLSPLKNSPL